MITILKVFFCINCGCRWSQDVTPSTVRLPCPNCRCGSDLVTT